jgi:hypothetical protein
MAEERTGTVDAEWAAFWTAVAEAATAALERLGDEHARAGEALFATNAARVAAGMPPLQH